MNTITTVKAREAFSEVLNRSAFGKERIILTRRGKGIVAVVPMEDLQFLEDLEDRRDVTEARKALKAGGKPVPIAQVKKRFGL